jgi:uncharacterized protein
MLIGRLDAVRRYPVKSLRGEHLDCARVEYGGIPGDRASALFVHAGHARVDKTYRAKEDDRLHLLDDEGAALAAAATRGVDARVKRGEHFFDAAPISIVVDRWMEDLNDRLGYSVEWERFRPNFFVRAAAGFAEPESDLVGATLRLGRVQLRVCAPIERCVAITYHPRGEPSDPQILRYLAQERAAVLGIYCEVLEPGLACVGDGLTKEAPTRDASSPPTPGRAQA